MDEGRVAGKIHPDEVERYVETLVSFGNWVLPHAYANHQRNASFSQRTQGQPSPSVVSTMYP